MGIVTDITKMEVVDNKAIVRNIKVDFPECHQWMGLYDVVEKAPPEELKVWFQAADASNQRYITWIRKLNTQ